MREKREKCFVENADVYIQFKKKKRITFVVATVFKYYHK